MLCIMTLSQFIYIYEYICVTKYFAFDHYFVRNLFLTHFMM